MFICSWIVLMKEVYITSISRISIEDKHGKEFVVRTIFLEVEQFF